MSAWTHGFGERDRLLLVESRGHSVVFTPRRPQDPPNGATSASVAMGLDEAQHLARHIGLLAAPLLPPSEVSGLWRVETEDGVRFGVQVPTGFGLAIVTGTWRPNAPAFVRAGLKSLVHGPDIPDWAPGWVPHVARGSGTRMSDSLDSLAESAASLAVALQYLTPERVAVARDAAEEGQLGLARGIVDGGPKPVWARPRMTIGQVEVPITSVSRSHPRHDDVDALDPDMFRANIRPMLPARPPPLHLIRYDDDEEPKP